jgi:hypothetical protein
MLTAYINKKNTIAISILVFIFIYISFKNNPIVWMDFCSRVVRRVHSGTLKTVVAKYVFDTANYLDIQKIATKVNAPDAWVSSEIEQNFSHYKLFGTESAIDTYNNSLGNDNFILFIIKDGKVTHKNKKKDINNACKKAINFYTKLLSYLAKHQYINNLVFNLRLSDSTNQDYSKTIIQDLAPIFAVTKDTSKHIDQYAILIPDWMNLESWPLVWSKIKKANDATPWDKKIPTIYWRGGDADVSGYRDKVVKLSKKLNYQKLDAQFTYGSKVTTVFAAPEDHIKYKYQLSIDGHTAAWERPVWQLYSNSILLKQTSKLNQWFYPALVNEKHYIEVGTDPDKLLGVLSKYTDKQLYEIANEGHLFAKNHLMPEDMVAYLILVLQKYEKLQSKGS